MSKEIIEEFRDVCNELTAVNRKDYSVNKKLREQNLVYEKLVGQLGKESANKVWPDIYAYAKLKSKE